MPAPDSPIPQIPEVELLLRGITTEHIPTVRHDLGLVDALESRLRAMAFTDPRASRFTLADMFTEMFNAARSSIVHWHAFQLANQQPQEPDHG